MVLSRIFSKLLNQQKRSTPCTFTDCRCNQTTTIVQVIVVMCVSTSLKFSICTDIWGSSCQSCSFTKHNWFCACLRDLHWEFLECFYICPWILIFIGLLWRESGEKKNHRASVSIRNSKKHIDLPEDRVRISRNSIVLIQLQWFVSIFSPHKH